MKLFLIIICGMTISLVAVYAWIAFVDGIVAGIRKLIPPFRKKTIVWHTLDEREAQTHEDPRVKQTHVEEYYDS